ncbi:MAG: hypothetical protein R3F24_06815 [Gammaproteobacteria bacterium]
MAVVWVGADDNTSTGLSGSSGALPIWSRMVADFGDSSYEPLPTDDLQYVSFDFETGMMAEPGCGDPVILPLPVGTVVPPNPLCGSGSGDINLNNIGESIGGAARQGVEWLKNCSTDGLYPGYCCRCPRRSGRWLRANDFGAPPPLIRTCSRNRAGEAASGCGRHPAGSANATR